MITKEIFNNATQGNTTNIQPLIKIEKGNTIIGLSTTSLTLDGLFYNPLLLNIPSIKESIDIESRKYKISSVNLNLSNAPYEGSRFSDKFNLLINAETWVYFKTQNANTLEDCLQVYYGRIRRMNQGENTLTLILEDSSEQKIHKDIPKNTIPADGDFVEKYNNKPYPMVIGKIDRSPCIVTTQSRTDYDIDNDGAMDEYELVNEVLIDSVPLSNIQSEKVYIGDHFIYSVPLWAYVDGSYVGLHRRNEANFDQELAGEINYSPKVDSTGFIFANLWNDNVTIDEESDETPLEQLAKNDTAANQGRVLVQRTYAKVEEIVAGGSNVDTPLLFESGIEGTDDVFAADAEFNIDRAWDDNPNSCIRITGTYKGCFQENQSYDPGNQQWGFLRYHFLPLPSGITVNPDSEKDWQKIISKVKIVGRESVTVRTWTPGGNNTEVNEYETTFYSPVVGVFQKNADMLFIDFNPTGSNFSHERGTYFNNTHNRLFYNQGLEPGQEGYLGEINSEATFGTNQPEYDSLFGEDDIENVSDVLVNLDSNSFDVGLPHIRHTGWTYGAAYNSRRSDGFENEVDARIFSAQIWASAKLENLRGRDFYANVWGRPSDRIGVYIFWFNEGSDTSVLSTFLSDKAEENGYTFEHNEWYDKAPRFAINKIVQFQEKEIEIVKWRIKEDYNYNLRLEIEGIYTSENTEAFVPGLVNVSVLDKLTNEESGYNFQYGYFADETQMSEDPLQHPSEVIKHILTEECGYGGEDNEGEFNEEEFQQVADLHEGWRYSFTQNKIINSKKLIEDIAKSSKTFPRFKSDGSFGWATTKDTYSKEDVDLTIESLDVLSYKFDRTKLEDVKTNVKVDFWKDYAGDNYVYSTDEFDVDNLFFPEGRDASNIYEYYNLPDDNSDSTLVLESDYIREYYTAEQLRNWLLSWYMNQHNLITLTLPLKYLKLEVGDIVEFDNEIQDMLLYGEKYTAIDDEPLFRNGQEIYPYFMITETNKSLDKITIKLTQLHKHDMSLYVPHATEEVLESPTPPTGDLNGDGEVNILDIALIMGYALDGDIGISSLSDEEFLYQADLNGDGSIDIHDVIILVGIILSGYGD